MRTRELEELIRTDGFKPRVNRQTPLIGSLDMLLKKLYAVETIIVEAACRFLDFALSDIVLTG
jgi:hypothetical protein